MIAEYFHKNGLLKIKHHTNDHGLTHNLDGPAWEEWYDNGQLKLQEYWINGSMNSVNGPSFFYWNESGKLEVHRYYLERELYLTFESFQKAAKISLLR